jgi:membrane-bound lytic murein transglycosylase D
MKLSHLVTLCLVPSFASFGAQDLDPEAYIDLPEVKQYVEYFTTGEKREWLDAALARGAIYSGFIAEKIEESSLPVALIYLPVIESGFNPNAVSPSGAAGLWQFMMNSIEPYDLRVNEWIDERKDFWKSTAASLAKLEYNKEVLGDWLLAIAAYNCGLNRMKAALEEAENENFWSLAREGYLPDATARYVPAFIAVAHIAGNAETYGVTLPEGSGWSWRRVPVAGQIKVSRLAEAAGIEIGILSLGNAELKHGVTPPAEYSYRLKVPDIYSDVIKRILQGVRLERFYLHEIESGDTLYALSRHFGVPVDLIMHHNPGIEPRFLKISAKLLIPVSKDVPPFPREPSTGNLQINREVE